jgi:hypothetical protein
VAHAAIEKVLTGARVWDEAAQPDLAVFLESVIDSEISHLVGSWEHRHVRPAAALPGASDDGEPAPDPIAGYPSPAAGPLERVMGGEAAGWRDVGWMFTQDAGRSFVHALPRRALRESHERTSVPVDTRRIAAGQPAGRSGLMV